MKSFIHDHQTTEKAIIRKEKHIDEEADDDEEIIYKIEIPANRFTVLLLIRELFK